MARTSELPRRDRRNESSIGKKDDAGVIVCWRDPDGHDRSIHEPGQPLAALRQAVTRIAPGGVVRSISTPRSILRDLTRMPQRHHGNRGQNRPAVDVYAIERQLLAKIGRTDLLPDEAWIRGRPT